MGRVSGCRKIPSSLYVSTGDAILRELLFLRIVSKPPLFLGTLLESRCSIYYLTWNHINTIQVIFRCHYYKTIKQVDQPSNHAIVIQIINNVLQTTPLLTFIIIMVPILLPSIFYFCFLIVVTVINFNRRGCRAGDRVPSACAVSSHVWNSVK
jgi:hypothetical protein